MRLKIDFKSNPNISIDLNYSHHLSSAIYRAIERADSTLSLKLHLPNVPKFFTFSKLMIPKKRIEGEKIIIESETVYFFFSTPKNELAQKLVEGLFLKPEIKIGPSKFILSQIEVLEEKKIGEKEKFVTLSPINASKVDPNTGKAIDLYPTEKEFYDVLKQNLVKKYKILYKKEPESDGLEFEPLSFKPKRIRIKNTWHRCVEMVFKAEGNPELLEIGYKAGFGAKNSMGFGMVKVL
ncbi:MAG: CRISPR-associated endoribonuclease Cas6 [Archaeoglobaceae archaeon]|nr:CRISPR-associated endoribonuclease Cas6 [Archaeoglobaceae archaeon]